MLGSDVSNVTIISWTIFPTAKAKSFMKTAALADLAPDIYNIESEQSSNI